MSNEKPSEFIVKGPLRSNFSQILNSTICDKRLSYKARGIHHYLLSKPANWRAVLADLINQSDLDGKDSVVAGLHELEALGYLRRAERPKTDGKFAGFDIFVYGFPISPDETGEDIPLRLSPSDLAISPDETGEGKPAPDNPLLQRKNNKEEDYKERENDDACENSELVDLDAVRRRNDEIFNRKRAQ